jgi:hypothetical protein
MIMLPPIDSTDGASEDVRRRRSAHHRLEHRGLRIPVHVLRGERRDAVGNREVSRGGRAIRDLGVEPPQTEARQPQALAHLTRGLGEVGVLEPAALFEDQHVVPLFGQPQRRDAATEPRPHDHPRGAPCRSNPGGA